MICLYGKKNIYKYQIDFLPKTRLPDSLFIHGSEATCRAQGAVECCAGDWYLFILAREYVPRAPGLMRWLSCNGHVQAINTVF